MTRGTICLAFALLALPFSPAIAGEAESSGQQNHRGSLLYRIHCQNCHGEMGSGNGPMAKLLTIQPADLTAISRRNDGDFPVERVRQAIDGRADVRAHGMREMPVWGLTFQQADRDSSQEKDLQARIDDLVSHLKSIQRVK